MWYIICYKLHLVQLIPNRSDFISNIFFFFSECMIFHVDLKFYFNTLVLKYSKWQATTWTTTVKLLFSLQVHAAKKLKLRMIKIQLYANLEPSQNSNKMNRQHLNSKSLFLLCVNLWHGLPSTVFKWCKKKNKKSSSFHSIFIKMQMFDIKYTNRF